VLVALCLRGGRSLSEGLFNGPGYLQLPVLALQV
jgi:hypothetical protein